MELRTRSSSHEPGMPPRRRASWRRRVVVLASACALVVTVAPSGAQDAPRRQSDAQQPGPSRIGASVIRQIEMFRREKRSWTPTQRKIESKLLLEYKRRTGMPSFVDLQPRTPIAVDPDGMTLVDIKGEVTPELLRHIEDIGGEVVNSHPRFNAVRARIPIDVVEEIAASPDVRSIRPAAKPILRKINTSQGDVAHRADLVRSQFGIDGSGVKLCAISDSIESLSSLQSSGDLPATVEVLSGQAGSGISEGTALLEILFDLAPGATLGFATANGGQAQFAQNIIDLRAAGCDVLVDDIFYPDEPTFQDGPIAAAIDQVTADGALYFSSAGNGGNLNDGTSGVWEGNYAQHPNQVCATVPGVGVLCSTTLHDFSGNPGNTITKDPPFAIILQWSDPQGGSSNDYDLFLLNSTGSTFLAVSANVQDGTQDPFEGISSAGFNDLGNIIAIDKFSGATRFLHLNTIRGRLSVATAGQISGHKGARSAIAVAAVDVALADSPFDGNETVETFSSDGPRRVFFEANGTAITPGNFLATGGELRQKPELTAADGVSTATPGPPEFPNAFNPFFGTSASAPHAAAVAGLVLSDSSNPTPAAVRQAMFDTALDIEASGFDRDSGHGIVDALAAIQSFARPDLVALWGKLEPGCLLAGETDCRIKGEVFVQNQGNANSVLSRLQFYHSTDGTLQRTTDTKVFTTSPEKRPEIKVLTPNEFVRLKVKVPLPGVTDTANDSVFVYADDGETNAETDETNNADRVTFAGPFVPGATITQTASAQDTNNLTTYTFPAQSLGEPTSDRKIVVGVEYSASPIGTITSLTVAGITATSRIAQTTSGGGEARVEIFEADVPTGTTGDIVVTMSKENFNCSIGVWRVTGAAAATNDTGASTAIPLNDTLDIPAGGVAVGLATQGGNSSTWTWTNLTEDFDTASETTDTYTGASGAFTDQQSLLSITATSTGAPQQRALALVSWGPS